MSNPATYLQMISTVTEDAQLRMETRPTKALCLAGRIWQMRPALAKA